MPSQSDDRDWVNVDVETITSTPKAVLLDFGAALGCEHRVWLPKSAYREVSSGNFTLRQIARKWMAIKKLWKWL